MSLDTRWVLRTSILESWLWIQQVPKTFYEFSQGWTEDQVQSNILDVYSKGTLSNFREIDNTSVMKCFMAEEMNIDQRDVFPNNELSDKDRAFMVVNYPLSQLDPNAPQWTLNHALDVLGVPEFSKHAMLLARPEDVRKLYAIWLIEQILQMPEREFELSAERVPVVDQPGEGETPVWFSRACTDLATQGGEVEGGETSSRIARAVIIRSALLWENGQTITYSYLSGNQTQKDKVDTVVQEWMNYANIVLQKVSSGGQIRITFNRKDGSWSYVGKETLDVAASKATMNFGWVEGGTTVLEDEERGVILHEFGHALGLLHEHQSPARGGTLTLNEAKVYEYYMETQGWSRATVKEQIIDVYGKEDVSNYSELDLTSVMMYFMPKEMNQEKIAVEPNFILSDLDKAYMVINYPLQTKDPKWTLAYALEVAGVTGRTKESIAMEQDAVVIRQKFSVWSAAQRAETAVTSEPDRLNRSGRPLRPGHALGNVGDGDEVTLPDGEELVAEEEHWCSSQEPDLIDDDFLEDRDGEGPARGVSQGGDRLWNPGETIRYFYQQDEYREKNPTPMRADRLTYLQSAFIEWGNASKLKFVKVGDEARADVKIFFHESTGPYAAQSNVKDRSWCKIGTKCRGWVNDPADRGGNATTTCFLILPEGGIRPNKEDAIRANRTCRHELGHMIGLKHEQRSPVSRTEPDGIVDRDIAIWTKWDPDSIMLYPGLNLVQDPIAQPPPKRRKVETETETGFNSSLSVQDKAFVKALYAWGKGPLEEGAGALGLGSNAVKAILAKVKGANTDEEWIAAMKKARVELAKQLQILAPANALNPSGTARALGPGRDAQDPNTADGRIRTDGDFLNVLVGSLKKFFNPGGNQIFTLQFPGRFLQISQYAWDTDSAGIYGQFIKPVVVNESEFRLTDQLYDVAEVVSGPNGSSMSQAYDTVINNLLPKFRANGLSQQQDQIRQWLLREVKTSAWVQDIIEGQHTAANNASTDDSEVDDGVGAAARAARPGFAVSNKLSFDGTVNRMELSNALMQEYLVAKQAWEVERDGMIEEALRLRLGSDESAAALNALTRRLAHTTTAREAQLAAKYSDAVVRGYTHNVREYVGYLDVKGPAEALQDAKDALREAAMSSLDGSLNVYPVQMTPIDWFEGLSTSFTLEDLTQDPALIFQQIRVKSQQLDVLNSQLTALRFGSRGDPAALRDAVNAAQQSLDSAQANLALKYTSNVIAMVKTCYTSDGALDVGQVADLEANEDITGVILDNLIKDMEATSAAQKQLTNASRAYSQALAGLALAEATDTQQQQEQIRIRVESLTNDLNELTARYTSLNRANDRPHAAVGQERLEDVLSFPVADDTAGGSRWQQIEFHHEIESDYTQDKTMSAASTSDLHVNLWLLSASTSQSSSQASSSSLSGSFSNSITVAFRATLVTVDRAGWFQPQFFKQAGSFYHIDPEITWSRSSATGGGIRAAGSSLPPQRDLAELNRRSLLPAFPVGYILCKDITIKIASSSTETQESKRNMREDAAASGGVLCFSYSQSSSSSQTENSYSFQSCSDGCVIRIPGPQILGYIIQLTDDDTTTNMPKKLPDDFFIPDAEYDAATRGLGEGPGFGLNPDGGRAQGIAAGAEQISPFFKDIDEILRQAGVSARAVEGVHEAMRKELDVLSDDVAARVRRG